MNLQNLQPYIKSSLFYKLVFVLFLFVLLFLSAISYRHTVELNNSTSWVIHTHEVNNELSKMLSYTKDAETGQRGFIITRDSVFLEPYIGALDKVNQSYNALKILTTDNPQQRKNLNKLYDLINTRFILLQKSLSFISRTETNTIGLRNTLIQGKDKMDEIRIKAAKMIDAENTLLEERQKKYQNTKSLTPLFITCFLLLTIIMMLLAYIKIIRDLEMLNITNAGLIISTESMKQAEKIGQFGLWQWNIETNKLTFSDNLFVIFGNEPQAYEPGVKKFLEIIHPEDLEYVKKIVQQSFPDNQLIFISYRILLKTGDVRYLKSVSKILKDAEGKRVRIGVVFDITDQHFAFLALEEKNLELQKINSELIISTESMKEAEKIGQFGLWQLNLETNKLTFSDNLFIIFGDQPQAYEPVEENLSKIIHPDDFESLRKRVEEPLPDNQLRFSSFRIILKTGNVRYINSLSKILTDAEGKKVRIGVTSDVTDQHLTFLALEEKNLELEKINAELIVAVESMKHAEKIGNFSTSQLDLQTNKLIYSDNQYALLGWEPQSFEPTMEHFMSFIHPDHWHIVKERIKSTTTEDEVPAYYKIIRKDGAIRYFKSIRKIITDIRGKKIRIGVNFDVTEEHFTLLALEEKKLELEKINADLVIAAESMKQAEKIGKFSTWQWDLLSNKLIYSDNQYALLGSEPQSFEPTIENYMSFVHPDDLHIITKGSQNIDNVDERAVSFRIIRKDGAVRYFKSIGKVITNTGSKKIRIGVNFDITEEQLINITLEQNHTALAQKNIQLASFNHMASHDLQEPLRKIQTFISRISEKDRAALPESINASLSKIEIAATRMRALIDNLLLFASAEKADKIFKISDLNLLIKKAIQECAHHIEEKNAVIETVAMPTLNVIPMQIEQLFINLLNNALKFSKPDIPPLIKIDCDIVEAKDYPALKTEPDKKFYKISVSDNGLGFEQQYAETIFNIFNRLQTTIAYKGTGIGLSICKKIVENHHGFITAQGMIDKGATFFVFLPSQTPV